MFVFYTKFNIIYRFGPYGKYHSTCGTLAFKKEYFNNNKFPDVNKAEEKLFKIQVYTLLDMIGDLGGFFDGLKILLVLLLNPYNTAMFNRALASNLFTFQIS